MREVTEKALRELREPEAWVRSFLARCRAKETAEEMAAF